MGVELQVMSSGSAEPGLDHVAAAFYGESGHTVHVTYNAEIPVYDVVVASADAIERKYRAAGLVEDGGESIGRISVGVGARVGAPLPDISTVEAFTAAVRAASAIILTDNHTSGLYMDSLFERLGLADEVGDRIERAFNGPAVMERLLAGSGAEISFLSLNEFRTFANRGIAAGGPLPEEVGLTRSFGAVPSTSSLHKDEAWEFVHYCGGPGRTLMAGHGFTV